MIKVLIAATLYLLLFVAVEVVTKRQKLSKEMSRKFIHVVAGVTVAFLPYVMSFHEIAWLSLLFIAVMLISKKANVFSAIHEVKRSTYGEVYFPFAILLTALLFPRKELYVYGLLVMAISDGFASIIGQKYGKHKYSIFGTSKSYVGSGVFFVTALAIGSVVLASLTSISILAAVMMSLISGALLTVVEAGLSRGLDNLAIPLLAACLFDVGLKLVR